MGCKGKNTERPRSFSTCSQRWAPEPTQSRIRSRLRATMTVAQWIIGIQLLHETAVPGTPVVSGHDVVKGQMAQPLGARRRIKWPPWQALRCTGEPDPGAACVRWGLCAGCRAFGASGRPHRSALRPRAGRQMDVEKCALPDGGPHLSTTQAPAHAVILKLEDFDDRGGKTPKT